MKKFRTLTVLCFMALVGAWGCGSTKKSAALKQPVPISPPTEIATATSEVDRVIAQARQRYFTGERELNLGHLEKAKEEFDASLDLLMQYQSQHEPDPKIEAVISELEDKIFNYEMAALKEGDGFTERPLEPAPIDDLKNIDTLPSPDQETKAEVQEELQKTTYDIPVEINDTVLSFIRIFQNSRRKEFVGGLIRSGRYLNLMKQIFKEEGMPQDLVYTALIESSFKANAYSRARAKGFWQFIAGTAKRYNMRMDWWIDERSDFETSTRAAARYLRDLHGMFGDWYLALAGYNAGENKIAYGLRQTGVDTFWQLARTRYIRTETKNYVPAILAAMIIAKDPQKYGFYEIPEEPLEFDIVNVDYTIDLRLVAECSGASLEEIKMLNPGLVRLTTPSHGVHTLRLPKRSREIFLAEVSSIPEEKRTTWRKHEVKPGETFTTIAALYRTPLNSLTSVNSLASGSTLSVGQKLVIPIGRSTPAYSERTYASINGRKQYHIARSGETMYSVARRYGCSVQQLSSWNRVSARHRLRRGERLLINGSQVSTYAYDRSASKSSSKSSKVRKIVYKVKRGDTLSQIANNYKVGVDTLKKWNKHARVGIYPGDRLTIYTK